MTFFEQLFGAASVEVVVGSEGKRNKIGLVPVTVRFTDLTDDTQRFIVKHGLKQFIADAASGVTDRATAVEKIEAKATRLEANELRAKGGERAEKPDTVESRAKKLAGAWFREQLKAEGIKADKAAIAEAITELVADDPKWTKEAKTQLDRENGLKAEPTSDAVKGLLAKLKAKAEPEADAEDEDDADDDAAE